MERQAIEATLQLVGSNLDVDQWALLEKYWSWLKTEALEAGGIGPSEVADLESRHLADSVLFARPWPEGPPDTVLDIGSGVGLPSLVLAILWPETEVLLLDRSGRRTDLARRAIRVLDLPNAMAVRGDVRSHRQAYAAVVMRAVYPPLEGVPMVAALIEPGGKGVIGLSRTQAPHNRPELLAAVEQTGLEGTVVEAKVLDVASWLLIMERS